MATPCETFGPSGWSLTEKRKAHLRSVLNGFGVTLEGDTLLVQGSAHELAQKKHNLIQAILAIGDMFVMAEEHVLSLFKEDVAAFLDSHRSTVSRISSSSGKSGLDHKFDFGVARSSKRPERVIQAINQRTKTRRHRWPSRSAMCVAPWRRPWVRRQFR